MAGQLECLVQSVDEVNKAFEKRDKGNKENRVEVADIIEQWNSAFLDIRESSELFNTVFGFQFTVMIATFFLYYVVFLYIFVERVVSSTVSIELLLLTLVPLFTFLFTLAKYLQSAHSLQHNSDGMRRQLGKLLNNTMSNAEMHKATKDFLRLVSTREVRIKAFGLHVDMTLFPACILLFTHYSIVKLQFQHIL